MILARKTGEYFATAAPPLAQTLAHRRQLLVFARLLSGLH
jgi:hypothetical protein